MPAFDSKKRQLYNNVARVALTIIVMLAAACAPKRPTPNTATAACVKYKPKNPSFGIQTRAYFADRHCSEHIVVDSDGDILRKGGCHHDVSGRDRWHVIRSNGPGFFQSIRGQFEPVMRRPPPQPTRQCANGSVSFLARTPRTGDTTFGICMDKRGQLLGHPMYQTAHRRLRNAIRTY